MGITWRASEADTLEAKVEAIERSIAALAEVLGMLPALEMQQAAAMMDTLERTSLNYAKRARLLRAEP